MWDPELSIVGFGNVVKRWLKTKRNKLKAQYMVGKKDCSPNIELVGWERLKAYWSKHETKRKAKPMSNVRSKVKNMGNVGQLGKTRKEARLALVGQPYQTYINIVGVVTLFLFNHCFVMGFLLHSLM
jgi:hypothetical protein